MAKKNFNTMYRIGNAKYVVNFHDGVNKHKDGSDFYDIKIFKNDDGSVYYSYNNAGYFLSRSYETGGSSYS